MFEFDVERFRVVIGELVRKNIGDDAWFWLESKFNNYDDLNAVFSLIPRKTGKKVIDVNSREIQELQQFRKNFLAEGWTADRLSRVCLLVYLHPDVKETYIRKIENLFLAAEMEELRALYSALPVFAWPASWKNRCAEGIRSNIAPVLESIMYENPFPAEQLDENAWNQLILKAFFTDKDVNRILGIEQRSNKNLALTLSDYAHERWAAGRSVNPLLWRFTVGFLDAGIRQDLRRILETGTDVEKRAAILAIRCSGNSEPADLLKKNKFTEISGDPNLTWESLAP